jgi:hypothetical protein
MAEIIPIHADPMDIDDMDVEIPLQEIRIMFEKQKTEIDRLKKELKKIEDDYFEAAAERDDALERLKGYEPTETTEPVE